jgi:hypothetical protein
VRVDEAAFIRGVNYIGTVRYNLPSPFSIRRTATPSPACGDQLLAGRHVGHHPATGYQGGELGRVPPPPTWPAAPSTKAAGAGVRRIRIIYSFGINWWKQT